MAKPILFIAGSDIDYFYEIENFLLAGDACLTKPLDTKVGGCVLNAASVCSVLGSNVKVLDYLKENDKGTDLIVNELIRHHVDVSHIRYGKDVENGTCLIMKKNDEKCIYVIEPRRPYFNEEDISDLLFNSSYIYSLMHTLNISFKDLNIIAKAKENGTKIIFDAGSQYIDLKEKDILLEYADGLFMNRISFNRLRDVCSFNPIEYLLNKGLMFSCITDGSNGTDLYTKDEIIHEDATKVDVIDSTGAGDSFAGAFLHFLNEGEDLNRCLKLASKVGAYACTKEGGMGACTSKEDLFKFIN